MDDVLVSAKGRAVARDYLRAQPRTEETVLLELLLIDYTRMCHTNLNDLVAELDAIQRVLFIKARDAAREVAS